MTNYGQEKEPCKSHSCDNVVTLLSRRTFVGRYIWAMSGDRDLGRESYKGTAKTFETRACVSLQARLAWRNGEKQG